VRASRSRAAGYSDSTYWQSTGAGSYADAALRGSSYLKLPRLLQCFTGNIGLHYVHHLSTRIPNHNLHRALDENPIFHDLRTLSLWNGLLAVRLKLLRAGWWALVSSAQARAD
jgi:acyl-lipid omega-6 desaturase (Delta-12 desaturase)